jgi:hypothetical protein
VTWSSRVEYAIQLHAPDGAIGGVASRADALCAYVTVFDTRIASIATVPRAIESDWPNAKPTAELVPTGQDSPTSKVLWKIDRVPARQARLLRYSLPIYVFTARCRPGLQITQELLTPGPRGAPEPTRTYRFTLRNASAADIEDGWLEVMDTRLPSSAQVRRGQLIDAKNRMTRVVPELQPNRTYCWTIPDLQVHEEVTLTYDAVG